MTSKNICGSFCNRDSWEQCISFADFGAAWKRTPSDFLAQQRSICPTIPQNEEQNLSAEQVEFVNEVAEAVVRPGLVWKDRPVDTILAVVAEKFRC